MQMFTFPALFLSIDTDVIYSSVKKKKKQNNNHKRIIL